MPTATCGSPPPAWGSHDDRLRTVDVWWFTPTRVGKPCSTWRASGATTVHPHPRGEAVPVARPSNRPIRFTPTRVGKPRRRSSSRRRSAVHPHPRGEAYFSVRKRRSRHGSPPPAWGSPAVVRIGTREHRFTPTRVGKPSLDNHFRAVCLVHPHPRGEAPGATRPSCFQRGSPPPAWGSHDDARPAAQRPRFTPTRVGKPDPPYTHRQHMPVHPHPRGEASRAFFWAVMIAGSPPPAWGSPSRRMNRTRYRRFTPTRVGKPLSSIRQHPAVAVAVAVHPHPRGEAGVALGTTGSSYGSPPPAWGSRRVTSQTG